MISTFLSLCWDRHYSTHFSACVCDYLSAAFVRSVSTVLHRLLYCIP
uniref:Uncharacterized protein n=1 Tax=Anguilla anguilla TaxID=7936 RepID=A0A0E9WKZ0_ANGAN